MLVKSFLVRRKCYQYRQGVWKREAESDLMYWLADSSKNIGSPKSARQKFAETPSSVRTAAADGDHYEGVLMVDDIFETKGVLVDIKFVNEAVEMTAPSARMVLQVVFLVHLLKSVFIEACNLYSTVLVPRYPCIPRLR